MKNVSFLLIFLFAIDLEERKSWGPILQINKYID